MFWRIARSPGHELADQVVAYAKCLPTASDAPEDVLRSRTNAIVSSAMILARDDAGIDQVGLFLPELARLIEEGPVPLPDVDHESSRGFSRASTGRLTDEIGHIDRTDAHSTEATMSGASNNPVPSIAL